MDIKALITELRASRRVIAEQVMYGSGSESQKAIFDAVYEMGAPLDALYKELDTTHQQIRALMGKLNGGDG